MEPSKEDLRKKFNLPSETRAQELRNLFSERIEPLNDNLRTPWKGRVLIVVEPEESREMVETCKEAMNFMGAIVDEVKSLPDGSVKLFSKGYYHHVGA